MNILLAPREGFGKGFIMAGAAGLDSGLDPVSAALAASRGAVKSLADLRFFTLKISDMGLGKVNAAVASRATRPLLPNHARSHARATTYCPAGPFALARRRRRCSRFAFCGR